jgi:hypothetical protein
MDVDRRVVEAAASYMADEDNGIGFVYSGWTQAALPHRRLNDDQTWQITSDHVKLLIEPGRRASDFGEPTWVGVPYGSRARLIMLYLQTEALRTNSREIELGKSLRAWLTRLGISIGGKSLKDVREQAERISRCRLTFHIQTAGRAGLVNQNIMDTASNSVNTRSRWKKPRSGLSITILWRSIFIAGWRTGSTFSLGHDRSHGKRSWGSLAADIRNNSTSNLDSSRILVSLWQSIRRRKSMSTSVASL